MKKLFMLFAIATLVCVGCSDEYDDSALRNDLSDLENRVQIRGTLQADEYQYFIVADHCDGLAE